MIFSSTIVTSGHGIGVIVMLICGILIFSVAIIVVTGMHTRVGRIAALLRTGRDDPAVRAVLGKHGAEFFAIDVNLQNQVTKALDYGEPARHYSVPFIGWPC